MPEVKLTYFALRGRAEPARILLAYGGVCYEDERLAPGWEDPTGEAPPTFFGHVGLMGGWSTTHG